VSGLNGSPGKRVSSTENILFLGYNWVFLLKSSQRLNNFSNLFMDKFTLPIDTVTPKHELI